MALGFQGLGCAASGYERSGCVGLVFEDVHFRV